MASARQNCLKGGKLNIRQPYVLHVGSPVPVARETGTVGDVPTLQWPVGYSGT